MLDVQASNESKTFVNWKSIYKKAEEALSLLGSSLSVRKNVVDLTLSEKQQVLIARAIVQNVDYLILDEPTAPLSVEETKQLFFCDERAEEKRSRHYLHFTSPSRSG